MIATPSSEKVTASATTKVLSSGGTYTVIKIKTNGFHS